MAGDQVAEVKRRADIVDLVGSRVELKKSGRNLKGLCPFHGERTPSFFVSPETQTFKCFGCGKGGDSLTFLQEYEGMTFVEALEWLAEKVGIQLERRMDQAQEIARKKGLEILTTAQALYRYLLTEHEVGRVAREYLEHRGVARHQWDLFGLGYAPDAWQTAYAYLVHKKGYSPAEVESVGLILQSERGRYYDRFRGRLMFGLTNFAGKVVGFSGRVLESQAQEAKYINTPETHWYHKSELLFGLSQAKQVIRKKDVVVVVEGEMDVLASHRAGVKQAVAVKGTALTEMHLQVIRRLTRNVVLALDADAAGQEAVRRSSELVERADMNLRIVKLQGGKDPDEIAVESAAAWKKMVKGAVSVYRYVIDEAVKREDLTSGSGIKRITEEVVPYLARITNLVERAYYVRLLAQQLGVRETDVEEEVVRKTKGQVQSVKKDEHTVLHDLSRQERLERYAVSLLLYLLDSEQEWREVEVQWWSYDYLKLVMMKLTSLVLEKGVRSMPELLPHLQAEQVALVEGLYLADESLLHMTDEMVQQLWSKAKTSLKERHKRDTIKTLLSSMSQPDVSDEQVHQWRGALERMRVSD